MVGGYSVSPLEALGVQTMVRVTLSEGSMVNVMVLEGPVQPYPVGPPVAAAAGLEEVVNSVVAVLLGTTKVGVGILMAMLVAMTAGVLVVEVVEAMLGGV